MKRILITGSGGANGIGFARSLRKAPEEMWLIGADAGQYHVFRSQTDERHQIPRADDPEFTSALAELAHETKADLISVHQSAELVPVSLNREKIGTKVMLPKHGTVEVCNDKYLSYLAWEKAGLPVPRTIKLNEPSDIKRAFNELSSDLWIRATVGSGGRNALPVDDYEHAYRWVDENAGWGTFTASERLSEQTVTWQSLWVDGELMVAQGRKRLYWEFGNRTASGVTGVTGAGVTISSAKLDDIAEKAILAIDSRPHGIFSVDFTLDSSGNERLTEINCGRFFTTHEFFTELGLNLPYLFVKTALGERPSGYSRQLNPLPNGMVWIRGMDHPPVLTTIEDVEASVNESQALIESASTGNPAA